MKLIWNQFKFITFVLKQRDMLISHLFQSQLKSIKNLPYLSYVTLQYQMTDYGILSYLEYE